MIKLKLFKVFLLGGILSAGLVAQYVYPDDFCDRKYIKSSYLFNFLIIPL